MGGTEFGEIDPYEARQQEADAVIDWLDGRRDPRRFHNGPDPHPTNPSLKVAIEVGEKPKPPKPGEIREGPGITLIAPDDDGTVTKKPYGTVLTPGGRRRANN